MQYKHAHYKEELENAPILLQLIASDFEKISKEFGIDPVVTRVIEKIPGDSGVHGQLRAVDFRNFHMKKYLYTVRQALAISAFINGKYQRLDGFKVCKHHNSGSGDHYHIQIPYITTDLRGPLWRE